VGDDSIKAESVERKKESKRLEAMIRKQGESFAKENLELREQAKALETKLKAESIARKKDVDALVILLKAESDARKKDVEALVVLLKATTDARKKESARLEGLVKAEREARKKDAERLEELVAEEAETRKRDVARLEEWLKKPFVGSVYYPTLFGCGCNVVYWPSSSIAKVYASPPPPRAKVPAKTKPKTSTLPKVPAEGGEAPPEVKGARKALPKIDVSRLTRDDATLMFWTGYTLYWQKEYDEALVRLDAAVKLADNDARFWYYKSLVEKALGEDRAATASLDRAVELHLEGKPRVDLIGNVLEKIQGDERRRLARALENKRVAR
jgi:tetratricopeptide (TPR) repeat protein